MTQIALNLSGYVNGVAQRHAITAREMFPGFDVRAVTNGVHVGTWAHPAFADALPVALSAVEARARSAGARGQLPDDGAVGRAREGESRPVQARARARRASSSTRPCPIIGFARRMTGYKRPDSALQRSDSVSPPSPRSIPSSSCSPARRIRRTPRARTACMRSTGDTRALRPHPRRVPAQLRHVDRAGAGRGRRRLAEHAAAAARSVRARAA